MESQTGSTIEVQEETISGFLLRSPESIKEHQTTVDSWRRRTAKRASEIMLEALSMPLFPGKEEGQQRAAGNDREREIAIKHALAHDETLSHYQRELDAARRELAAAKGRDKNYRVVARLMIVETE